MVSAIFCLAFFFNRDIQYKHFKTIANPTARLRSFCRNQNGVVDLLLFRADASRRCQSHGRPSGKGRRRRADHTPPPPSLAHRSSMVRNFAGARRCRSTTIEAHINGALLSKLTMSEHVVDVREPEHYSRGDGDRVMRALTSSSI